jgi:uncharacterized protein (UPF0276 family)
VTSQFAEIKKSLPSLGVGLGLRRELAADTFEHADQIDWLEFVPENYMSVGGAARERLERARSAFPIVSHGVNLSLGTTDEINDEYIASISRLLDGVDSPWWSDHLCFTSHSNLYMHDLLPLPFSREAVKHVGRRAREVQERVGRPLLLENISFYMQMPGSEMTEPQFLAEVLEEADCGLLLDVNNIYVNCLNHKFDPYEYLDSIPLERTIQIHLAGHSHSSNVIIDTHGAAVVQPVFDLLEYVLKRTEVKAVMLERDQNFPAFPKLLAELEQIRQIIEKTQPAVLDSKRRQQRSDYIQVQMQQDGAAVWREGKTKGREQVSALTA